MVTPGMVFLGPTTSTRSVQAKLTGLGQIFFGGQSRTFAEQGLQILLCYLDMTGGSLHQYLIAHFYFSSQKAQSRQLKIFYFYYT